MRIAASSILISALLLASTSSLATPPAAEGGAPAAKPGEQVQAQPLAQQVDKEKPKPKVICRTIRNTGFRTAARQCKTQEDWEEEDAKVENGDDLRLKTGSLNPG